MKLQDIERLAATGKIRGYKASAAPKSGDLPKRVQPDADRPTGAKAKAMLKAQIALFCIVHKKTHLQEQVFHEKRKWRFDHVVCGPGRVVAMEYEGIFNGESAHRHETGFLEDAEKYNEATMAGIPLLRYTARSVNRVFRDLERMFKINQ